MRTYACIAMAHALAEQKMSKTLCVRARLARKRLLPGADSGATWKEAGQGWVYDNTPSIEEPGVPQFSRHNDLAWVSLWWPCDKTGNPNKTHLDQYTSRANKVMMAWGIKPAADPPGVTVNLRRPRVA